MKRRGFFASLFGLAAAPAVAKHVPGIVTLTKQNITAGGVVSLRPITDAECQWLRGQLELARKRSTLQLIERETRYVNMWQARDEFYRDTVVPAVDRLQRGRGIANL